jgi:CheY-like chemotaxis protein
MLPEEEKKLDFSALSGLKGTRVLVVEDNQINQEIAVELLSFAGLDVSIANNGQEAIDKVNNMKFDLVLMDIQMPVKDGYEATKEIRQVGLHNDLPIIAMTANAMSGDRERCLSVGMNDHLPKPINPQQVFKTIAQWVAPKENVVAVDLELLDDTPTFNVEGFDTTSAILRMAGNLKAYKKTLSRVIETENDIVARVQLAMANNDIGSAILSIHSLKGVAATIGAIDLVSPLESLENTLTEQQKNEMCEVDDNLRAEFYSLSLLVDKAMAAIAKALAIDDSVTEGRSKDKELFLLLSSKILEQLDNFDSSAVDTFDDMITAMGEKEEEVLAKEIVNTLSRFDFEEARPLVEKFIGRHSE